MDDDWLDDAAQITRQDTAHESLVTAVGHVAIASAELEEALRGLLRSFLLTDEAWLIGQGETAGWLVQNCLRIVEERYLAPRARNVREDLVAVLRDCDKAFERRNTVVHGTWYVTPGGQYLANRSKRYNEPMGIPFSLSDLASMAETFDRLSRAVWAAG